MEYTRHMRITRLELLLFPPRDPRKLTFILQRSLTRENTRNVTTFSPDSSSPPFRPHIASSAEKKMIEQKPAVVVVGAGPSGLATSACLKTLSIPHILLEREDCSASLWKKYAYDRLHLHLRKRFCELPHMHFPPDYPEYVPKDQFLRYLDGYAARFAIEPAYGRSVESAAYDEVDGRWRVSARDTGSGEVVEFRCRFLVVATGESSDAFIPEVEGIEGFPGKVIHSTGYKNGKEFE